MQNFHDNKLWQDSFVALMDVHDLMSELITDEKNEIVTGLLEAAKNVTSKIADALSRNDRRIGRNLIYDTVGLVAVTRTQLAIAWGRGLIGDDTFRSLDDKYAKLSDSLQQFK
jgi:four helix bundle protein